MLEILNSGKMAKQFGKHRGWITACGGVVLWLIALFVSKAQDIIYATASKSATLPEGLTSLDWMAMVLFAIGAVIALFGAWQLYRDEVHGDYITDADRYRREGW